MVMSGVEMVMVEERESCPRYPAIVRRLWLRLDATCSICLQPPVILVLVVICAFFVVWWTDLLYIFSNDNLKPAAVDQMLYASRYRAEQYRRDTDQKYILVWTGCYGSTDCGWGTGSGLFTSKHCPESRCFMTTNRQLLDEASVVIFHIRDLPNVLRDDMPSHHRPDQIWVFMTKEPPYFTFTGAYIGLKQIADVNKYSGNLEYLDGKFNATMTYMTSSDFPVPYCTTQKRTSALSENDIVTAANKTKLAVWLVSNCSPRSMRSWYAKELQKHIQIDVFGNCGKPLPCKKHDQKCLHGLLRQYKFYLAFENSQCREYITEKFWRSLQIPVVPVALGAWIEDYLALTPPKSVIHVDNFTDPADLGEYLKYLDQNDTAYNEYLAWRTEYTVCEPTDGALDPFCKMCKVAHNASLFPRKSYNVSNWYSPNHLCRDVRV